MKMAGLHFICIANDHERLVGDWQSILFCGKKEMRGIICNYRTNVLLKTTQHLSQSTISLSTH
jgi:hypothetical protein